MIYYARDSLFLQLLGGVRLSRILVTSCKGGVGKSTVSIGIATALAVMGRRVLLIDFDLGNRSLDLMLGMQDDIIYDIADLASGRSEPEDVVKVHHTYPNLAFIGAPFRYDGDISEEGFKTALEKLDETFEFDYIIVDTSGGAHESVSLSAPSCDSAIIVSSQSPIAIRAAEKSGMILDEYSIEEQFLIVNGFDMGAERRAGVLEMIDRTRTPLLGIVPMDVKLSVLNEDGKNIFDSKKCNSRTAFENIARRLAGESVPLLRGFVGIKRDKILFR